MWGRGGGGGGGGGRGINIVIKWGGKNKFRGLTKISSLLIEISNPF